MFRALIVASLIFGPTRLSLAEERESLPKPRPIATKVEGKRVEETKKEDTKKEEPKKGESKKEETKKEEPKKEEPKKEEPKKEETKKEEPKKEEPKKEEAKKKTEHKKEEPKKEEPKKEEPKKEEHKKEEAKKENSSTTIGKSTPAKANQLKKYDDVITKDAKSSLGLFAVHRIDERVYFEIAQEKLGGLMLWRAETAKGPAAMSHNGQQLGVKFVKFERRENKMYLIEADFEKRAGKDVQESVEDSNTEAILAVFPVECEGKDRSAVIQVTAMYMNDVTDIGARRAAGPTRAIDHANSHIADVKTFPTNIEVRVQLGLRSAGAPAMGPMGPVGPPPNANRVVTALVHFSLAALPETPMQGRYYDPRIGYFTESFAEFSGSKPWVRERQFIARFRLEKKDPSAAVSEPIKPIVFYLAPEIPEKWRPYFKKGIEDWAPAFEKAGFKNAIICKEPPTRGEDPNWDPEDARYSVIRWVAEPVTNAMGPHVHDPRSGEIISGHVIFWHDIVKLVHLWYFVECSANDERARKFPFPDELTGELLRYVACHEVGHALGLRHNHRASQAYSIEQLRDPKFLEKHGNVSSIMSYGRYNYVAQPEDKIPVKDLIPKVGPYDFFAIEWGYKPVPSASNPDAERTTLDEWAARQIHEPFLRHGGEDASAGVDPTVLTENIGSDPVRATELGLKNIDRELDFLLDGV